MANAICVRTTVESETMRIPELSPFIGKRVQIIVVEDESPAQPAGAPTRTLGSLRGALKVPDDFDAPLPDEILRAFEGETDP
jgi:hypothetical protein